MVSQGRHPLIVRIQATSPLLRVPKKARGPIIKDLVWEKSFVSGKGRNQWSYGDLSGIYIVVPQHIPGMSCET